MNKKNPSSAKLPFSRAETGEKQTCVRLYYVLKRKLQQNKNGEFWGGVTVTEYRGVVQDSLIGRGLCSEPQEGMELAIWASGHEHSRQMGQRA